MGLSRSGDDDDGVTIWWRYQTDDVTKLYC